MCRNDGHVCQFAGHAAEGGWDGDDGGVASWVIVLVMAGAGVGGTGAGWLARVVLGRLRHPVRLRPLLVEATVCLLWTLVTMRAVNGAVPFWWLPVPAALCWFAVVLTATDITHRRLPNAITLAGYPVLGAVLVLACLGGAGQGLGWRALAASVALVAVHMLVHFAAPGQLGAGDVKLAGVVGAVLGAVSWSAVLLGQVVAALVTVGLALVDRRERGAPHGPGMLAGALLVAVFPGTGALAG